MIRTLIFASIMLVSICGCGSSTTDKTQTKTDSPVKNLIEIYVVKDGKKIGLQDFLDKCPDEMNDKSDDSAVTKALKKAQRQSYHLDMIQGDIYLEFIYNDSYFNHIVNESSVSRNSLSLKTPGWTSYLYNGERVYILFSTRKDAELPDKNKLDETIKIETNDNRTDLTFNEINNDDVKMFFKVGNKIRITGRVYQAFTDPEILKRRIGIRLDSLRLKLVIDKK